MKDKLPDDTPIEATVYFGVLFACFIALIVLVIIMFLT
jgi:hypothetical protein